MEKKLDAYEAKLGELRLDKSMLDEAREDYRRLNRAGRDEKGLDGTR